MIEKVVGFIEKERLFKKSNKILVALSGGADSVALLHVLLHEGYDCVAAHCNFGLRGDESDRDELFVRRLCSTCQVPLYVTHFQTREYAGAHRISIEMAARDLRYEWFDRLRRELQRDVVAVAHHRDDSVETFLLNLVRGTGLSGLQGIRPRNGFVVRPLLAVSREEIVHYLQQIHQPYVTDSTNLQDEFMRNKIRLNILPLLEEMNPAVREHIAHASSVLQQVGEVYQAAVEEEKKQVMKGRRILIPALLEQPAPDLLLFEILSPYGFNAAQLQDISAALLGQSGKEFWSKTGCRLVKDRDELLVQPDAAGRRKEEPDFSLSREDVANDSSFLIPRGKEKVCFDAGKLQGKLEVRRWRKGDWFVPFGMNGRKLVSDYLTDRKFSVLEKEEQWVLTCDESVVWLIGERTDNRYRVDKETKKIAVFTLHCS